MFFIQEYKWSKAGKKPQAGIKKIFLLQSKMSGCGFLLSNTPCFGHSVLYSGPNASWNKGIPLAINNHLRSLRAPCNPIIDQAPNHVTPQEVCNFVLSSPIPWCLVCYLPANQCHWMSTGTLTYGCHWFIGFQGSSLHPESSALQPGFLLCTPCKVGVFF